jgi:hypothetical protein
MRLSTEKVIFEKIILFGALPAVYDLPHIVQDHAQVGLHGGYRGADILLLDAGKYFLVFPDGVRRICLDGD